MLKVWESIQKKYNFKSTFYRYTMQKSRCAWVNLSNPEYVQYHDQEWWVPVYDDQVLFEFLILEWAQAGLSWETVLNKRENYRKIFHWFDAKKCSKLTDDELEKILENPAIIRNKLKIFSVRKNAQVFLEIQKEFWSFSDYLWSYVWGKQIINSPKYISQVPVKTQLSETLSKVLKKRGMSFVWPTIIYSYLQASWLIDDHTLDCFCKKS